MRDVNKKLSALRAAMRKNNVDALIIPSQDPHQSEYVTERYMGREWISGFTGSAGTAVVTQDFAGLWTDARYYLQAEEELSGTEFQMKKLDNQGGANYVAWLKDHLEKSSTVAIDGDVCSLSSFRAMNKSFSEKGIQLQFQLDVLGEIWEDRSDFPKDSIYEHEVRYAGKSRGEKIDGVRKEMESVGADYHLVVPLDAIAWTLNLRGSDVAFNPVFISFLVIGQEDSFLFVDKDKVPDKLVSLLGDESIRLRDYSEIGDFLEDIEQDKSVLIDPRYTSITLYHKLESNQCQEGDTIPMLQKAIKNDVELQHFEKVMPRDGVAIFRAMRWLRSALEEGQEVTEYEFSQKLGAERSKMENYVGESFNPIVGYRGNGAIIHYKAKEDTSHVIKPEGMLLIDNGGQFLDGTTDITRTFHLSTPTETEKEHYTLVLKGHINLARARFPRGTRGIQLDALARQPLWMSGLDFAHGTGHGVGFFMNVHEGPQGFAPALTLRGKTVMKPGMVSSNEPGYYRQGEYGIRIENIVVCEEGEDGFLEFRDFTVYPMSRKLIDVSLLAEEEIRWLDRYHEMVYEKMSPLCTEEEKKELEALCAPIR